MPALGRVPPAASCAASASCPCVGTLMFAGAFISLQVAATIAKDFIDPNVVTPEIVFGGLIGAIIWNLATWYFGLPSSSSHALIGGVVGAVIVAAGTDAVSGQALLSPEARKPVMDRLSQYLLAAAEQLRRQNSGAAAVRTTAVRNGHGVCTNGA